MKLSKKKYEERRKKDKRAHEYTNVRPDKIGDKVKDEMTAEKHAIRHGWIALGKIMKYGLKYTEFIRSMYDKGYDCIPKEKLYGKKFILIYDIVKRENKEYIHGIELLPCRRTISQMEKGCFHHEKCYLSSKCKVAKITINQFKIPIVPDIIIGYYGVIG